MPEPDQLTYPSTRGRWVLAATVLGSGLASLDATVVNVALPAIGRSFGGGVAQLQWTIDAYGLTLSAFLLLAGALGDRFGRKRVFRLGVIWFAAASVACGLAPSGLALILARALQGVGAALLAPGSLAILEASFREEDRATVIGSWTAFGGVAVAVGPFVGGYLVQAASWRWIFLVNLPVALATVLILQRHVPETRDPTAPPSLDFPGAALAVIGLGGITYALIEAPGKGLHATDVLAGACGVLALLALLVVESFRPAPMLPLGLFRSRQFTAANAETLVVYAALSGALFLLPVHLQHALGYSPVAAGAALLPATVLMLLLSSRVGRLSARLGPRVFMTAGPLLIALGLLLLRGVGRSYRSLLPGVTVFGLGLALNVAPLTATVLAAAPAERAGVASAINNWVARTAGLLAVALLPALAGAGRDGIDAAVFGRGLSLAAGLCVAGGLVSLLGIRNPQRRVQGRAPAPHCPLDAPPLRG
jgi:EmrB/QacA subfamily drug resistance transporter